MTFNLINKLIPFSPLNFTNHQELPWLDQPNAQEQLNQKFKQRKFYRQTYQLLSNGIEQGYIFIKNLIPETLIDELVDELANLFFLDAPLDGFQIEGIQMEGLPTILAHKDVLELDLETRQGLVKSI